MLKHVVLMLVSLFLRLPGFNGADFHFGYSLAAFRDDGGSKWLSPVGIMFF